MASWETQEKLENFYSDITGNFMKQTTYPKKHPLRGNQRHPAAAEEQMQQSVATKMKQMRPTQIGLGHDSPQQSTRRGSVKFIRPSVLDQPSEERYSIGTAGLRPLSRLNSTAAIEVKVLHESPLKREA